VDFAFRMACALVLAGCRDHHRDVGVHHSALETGIGSDLSERFAVPVTASCKVIGVGMRCEAKLDDGTTLPIEVGAEHGDWTWHVSGIVVEKKPLTDYIAAALADIHVDERVDCATVQVLKAGDRATCKLSGGGLAFVQFAADGTGTLELALDAAAAAARGEPVTPQREQELFKISRALEGRQGQSDGEEEAVPGDGGVEDEDAMPQVDGSVAKP
jgi:hypothetical protein